ncbi:MAG: helix-turn-helix domain-containing protein [Pseudomonadota bacterium]
MDADPSGTAPHFAFILQPEFPLNALVLASDALRIANQNSGAALFAWSFLTHDGEPVRASNGMWFAADGAVEGMQNPDVALVFEGNRPTQTTAPSLLNALRAAARFGAIVGGVDTGAFALAQAGLVGEEPVVVHWEAAPAFTERFRGSEVRGQINLLGNTRGYSAGGVATLDLVLDLIERFHGAPLASEVANALVHTRRPPSVAQRADAPPAARQGSLGQRMVALMERRLDFPLDLEGLAAELNTSPRTLSRECRRTFGEPPMRLYLHIRLQAARNFLFYDELSIKDVALACGFSYPAVFSRAFKAEFGVTPQAFRTAFRKAQSPQLRPEIRRLIQGPERAR